MALFLEILNQDGPSNCTKLVGVLEKPIPKSTLSLQTRMLREAGLIGGERQGEEMRNSSRLAEVDARYPGLLLAIVTAHTIQVENKRKRSSRLGSRTAASRSET